MIIKYQ